MGYSFYQYFAFFTEDSDASLEALQQKLVQSYAGLDRQPEITLNGEQLVLRFGTYHIKVDLNRQDYVQAEAQEVGDHFLYNWKEEPLNIKLLKTCKQRFEVAGEEDYDMNYFNDSIYVVEAIDSFSNTEILNVG